MNSKMTTNSQLSTTEPKRQNQKLSKLEQKQNHRNGDHMEGYQWGWGGGRIGEKVQGIRSINVSTKQAEVKNSIGNEEAKELICMTHGHELREWGGGGEVQGGGE